MKTIERTPALLRRRRTYLITERGVRQQKYCTRAEVRRGQPTSPETPYVGQMCQFLFYGNFQLWRNSCEHPPHEIRRREEGARKAEEVHKLKNIFVFLPLLQEQQTSFIVLALKINSRKIAIPPQIHPDRSPHFARPSAIAPCSTPERCWTSAPVLRSRCWFAP